ncbi:MAG: hypothetical protein ABR584_04635 [Candidatus Baltobacteraceae bacterium]
MSYLGRARAEDATGQYFFMDGIPKPRATNAAHRAAYLQIAESAAALKPSLHRM